MTLKVVWAERALDRLELLLEVISQDRPDTARKVINDMFDRAAALADFPEMGRIYDPAPELGLRQLVVGRYRLIYRVDAAKEEVEIVAARHHREADLASEELM